MTTLKIVLLGDGGVGKTTYIKKIRVGTYEKKYIPTMGVNIHPITWETDKEKVIINCWDCAGQEKFGGLKEVYYIGADAFIIFFDTTNKLSYKNVGWWIKSVRKVYEDKPIIVCGLKSDSVKCNMPKYPKYDCLVDTRTTNNVKKPFSLVLKKLFPTKSI